MGYEDQLNSLSGRIDEELRKVLDEKIRGQRHSPPFIEEVYEFIKDYVLRRGKRLASSCTVMAFKGVKGEEDERILRAATSIEFFRHSILSHDDLVDEDELRRGEPSVHAAFRDLHKERFRSGDSERFGDGMAVFIGNMLISLACEILCSSGFEAPDTQRALQLLTRNFRLVNDSQVLDLLFEFYEPTEEEWFAMARTRAPTLFETSILLGAILAGASEDQMEALRDYAWNIGYAFDIQDDIIGSFASEEEYGRPPMGDIALGKKTLFVIKALKKATGEDGFFLRRVLGKRGADGGEIERFKEIVVKTGALEEARLKSRELAGKAVRALEVAGLSEEAEGFFVGLSDFIVESMEWYT
ncbi:MAG: polyprenyl synthetase family protein [Candidatus Geothermarchaeales archaeon]